MTCPQLSKLRPDELREAMEATSVRGPTPHLRHTELQAPARRRCTWRTTLSASLSRSTRIAEQCIYCRGESIGTHEITLSCRFGGQPDAGTGRVFVRHEANHASGGSSSDTELGAFLARGGMGPEKQELLRLIGGLIEEDGRTSSSAS